MSDIGTPERELLIARAQLGVAESELQIEHKQLRLMELDEEEERIKADQKTHAREAKLLDAPISGESPVEGTRRTIKASGHRLEVQRQDVRLLEIEAERRQVGTDMTASRAHIASLQAEIAQQEARASGQEKTRG